MLKAFQIEDEPERIDVIYLDTPARDCLKAGWVSRIRVKEGKPRYTITYKMRYPVQDGDELFCRMTENTVIEAAGENKR